MATRITVLKKKEFKNPILLTGLPGIGLVGKICVDYLLKQFKHEIIAVIISDAFPPSVHTQNALIQPIQDEIVYCKIKDQDFLFLAGPVQPHLDVRFGGSMEHYEFAESILVTVKKMGVKQIFTLAGINIGEQRLTVEPKVIVSATNQKLVNQFKKDGAFTAKHDGLISGAAGLLLGLGKEQGIEGACLMGETNPSLVYGDHGAAKKVLELLSKHFDWKVNMQAIDKESQGIEKAFTQLAKQLEEQHQHSDKPGPDGLTYVR
ncbi:PAC2 family protein [Candidatus Micrarchaeota archaeon]|nr:PAC2 family protein [Candidatus Micrarchaeota archaeon]MBU1929950.1 PAC2 family protein [Candidatus Micrarchaeota archaeon]